MSVEEENNDGGEETWIEDIPEETPATSSEEKTGEATANDQEEDLKFIKDDDDENQEEKSQDKPEAESDENYEWEPSEDYKEQWTSKGEEGEKRYEEFKTYAKENGIKSEVFKNLMTRYEAEMRHIPEQVQQQLAKEWTNQTAVWLQEVKGDSEIGGKNWPESKKTAMLAVKEFGGKELADELFQTGYANNPKIFKAFYTAGKMLKEGSFVQGGAVKEEIPIHKKLFPKG